MAYIPTAQNTPPYDGSGGKLILTVANGTLGVSYTVGVHIQTFSTTPPGSSPFNWPYAGGAATQFNLDGGSWTGTETGVGDTAAALLAVLKPFYGTQWTLSLKRLMRYDPANKRYVRVAPKPVVASQTGTGAGNPSGAGDVALITESIYTAPAALAPNDAHGGVGRFRLVLPAADLRAAQAHVDDITSGSSAGGLVTARDTALIGYLAGSATRIIAHNGGLADNLFNIHVAPSDRLRRALDFV